MNTKKQIAVGLITCDRVDFFKRVVSSMPSEIELLVVNDGTPFKELSDYHHIQNKTNIGVGASKNIALKYFYDKGYEHIFLMEDDIKVLDRGVFQTYIDAAAKNNFSHLNFGLSARKNPLLKQEEDLNYYKNPYAGFSYFKRCVIKEVGYFDERFYNALEHIDYTLRISLKGMHPYPQLYPDIRDSHLYLTNVEENFKGSVIRRDYPKFKKWIKDAIALFEDKWKVHPAKIGSCNWMEWSSSKEELAGAVKKT